MTRTGWLMLLMLCGCAAPQPTQRSTTPTETDSESPEPTTDADADADADSDADADADADADSDADSDSESREPTSDSDAEEDADYEGGEDDTEADYPADLDEADDDEDADYEEPLASTAPSPRPRTCAVPDPPAGAGAECPVIRRRWQNVPAAHMRCRTDADCVAVPAGHCRYVALNRPAARRPRYREPVCAGRGEGACGAMTERAVCTSGCCEWDPMSGFF